MKSVSREAMRERLQAYKEDIINDIRELIAFKSVTDDREATKKALEYVIEKAKALGMNTGYTSGMDAGYAEIGEGEELVGVLAHVDVVDIGDIDKWPHDPFDLMITEDGFMHARGIVDDKGPVIMSLYALRVIKELGVPLGRRIRLIVGTSEEAVWVDMQHYAEQFGMPTFGFSPDGNFPVYNIEKGYCDISVLFRETGRLGEIVQSRAGKSNNSVPSKAVFQLAGGDEIIFNGRAVHSSIPQEGDNAMMKLAAVAAEKGFLFGKFLLKAFTDEYASGLVLDDGTDTCDGVYVGRTISCPTVMELTEKGVRVNVNIRSRYGVDKAWLENAFARYAKEYDYSFEFVEFTGPNMVDPRLPFLQQMLEVYRSYSPEDAEFRLALGASYAATMKNCVCFGPVFDADPDCAHEEDERFHIDTMMRATDIYCEYLITCAEK